MRIIENRHGEDCSHCVFPLRISPPITTATPQQQECMSHERYDLTPHFPILHSSTEANPSLIATPHDRTALPRLLQRLHSEYARALHLRLRRVGHLWQARYGSAAMDTKHLWSAMVYVEQNPVRAALVTHPEDWRWSSARAHLDNDDHGWLDFVDWRKQFTVDSWKHNLQLGLADATFLERVREATRHGWPLGSDPFLDQLEREHGTPVRRSRPGPKPMAQTPIDSITSEEPTSLTAAQFGS